MGGQSGCMRSFWAFLFFSCCAAAPQSSVRPLGKTEIRIAGRKAWASASSELKPASGRYAVANAFDGDRTTAWVEGAENAGEGSFLEIEFEEPATLDGFALRPGYVKNASVFTANAAPRVVEVQVDGRASGHYIIGYDLTFIVGPKGLQFEDCYHTGAPINIEAPRVVMFEHPVKGRKIRITVTKVLTGSRYTDLAITDWEPLLADAPDGRLVDAKIAAVLRSLRDETVLKKHLAPHAHTQDLRQTYIFNGNVYEGEPPAAHSPHFARVDQGLRGKGDTLEDRFLRYTKSALLDAAVLVETRKGTTRIVGAKSFRHGDGEWIEFYPVIELDNGLRINSLTEASHTDGAPGCHDLVPRAIARRVGK